MKITLAAGFVSNSTDFRQIGSCSALFAFQIPEIDLDRSENIIHQLSSVFCCETKGAAFASESSCLILDSWNIAT
jgi:hypothetical protein